MSAPIGIRCVTCAEHAAAPVELERQAWLESHRAETSHDRFELLYPEHGSESAEDVAQSHWEREQDERNSEIRRRRAGGETIATLARDYELSTQRIGQIVNAGCGPQTPDATPDATPEPIAPSRSASLPTMTERARPFHDWGLSDVMEREMEKLAEAAGLRATAADALRLLNVGLEAQLRLLEAERDIVNGARDFLVARMLLAQLVSRPDKKDTPTVQTAQPTPEVPA
jgi:hypothetical protein